MGRFSFSLITLVFISFVSLKSFGWGERGHHTVCEVATRLIDNPELANFLQGRGHLSGHVCNIPDIHWKDHPENSKVIDASHFMDPENLNYKISEVPLDFNQVIKEKSKSKEQVALELGSLWWRAEQFYRRATEGVKLAKGAEFPDKNDYQSKTHPYNRGVFDFIVNISLMGHFVGDASVPYHNTSDYDGWEKGRGGIHAYYESLSVNALGLDLETKVYEQALLIKKQSKESGSQGTTSVTAMMKELSSQALNELTQVEDADPLSVPSDKETKTYAKRPSAEKGAAVFKALIIPQMARSSIVLAKLWEKAWEAGGSVSFKGYKSYRYPLAPEIVPLDYLGQ